MDKHSEVYVTKLLVQDKPTYIKLIWKHDDKDLFEIEIFCEDKGWAGKFTNENSQEFYKKENIKESAEEYSSNVKKCLTGEGDYKYFLETKGDDNTTFTWKKSINTLKLVYGYVTVTPITNSDAKNSLIDILLEKNKELKVDINELNKKSDNVADELEMCRNELDKYVDLYSNLEASLYSKFVQVLNTKKQRIQTLEDILQNFEKHDMSSVDLDYGGDSMHIDADLTYDGDRQSRKGIRHSRADQYYN